MMEDHAESHLSQCPEDDYGYGQQLKDLCDNDPRFMTNPNVGDRVTLVK
jgi:hypothetical protein